jgi:DNA-binding transcriptional LysR family regulator
MSSHNLGRTLLTLSAVPSHSLAAGGSATERRAHRITTLPDGRVVDETAMADWLIAMDRRNERVTVARLSESDAACQAAARGRRS